MKRWAQRGVAALAVWAALLGYAELDNRRPHPVGLAAAVLAILAVVWLCTDAYEVAQPPQWALYHSRPPTRSFDPRFSRLSQQLAEATDRHAAAVAVHTSVSQAAEGILLDKYGVDSARDPEQARQILGDLAADFVAAGPAEDRFVFSPELFDVLDRLESL
ncbi:MAG: hypothetical protein QOI51_2046 [Nocardioidaceae bacterium]|jgi:hypothetical protein|nr:hypothetical protein [Nocardioidaceae bacterium]MDX6308662.1 hypothetical protein [Nocardioidaceae bacterium]